MKRCRADLDALVGAPAAGRESSDIYYFTSSAPRFCGSQPSGHRVRLS
jgi:hypothetical protein